MPLHPLLQADIPLALIEAKDNSHSVGEGIQQGLDYATTAITER